MSRKKLITDNLIILIGGNIGNIFSFLTNFILIAQDKKLANLYVAYNSIVLILGVPSLVAMRMFTLYGDTIIVKLGKLVKRSPNIIALGILLLVIGSIPLGYLVTIATEDGNLMTTALILILSFITFIVYSFRGLKQFEENFIAPVISLNIETLGRTILALFFGITLGWGIYGVFLGSILAMALAIIPCFEFRFFKRSSHDVTEYRLKSAFINSFILTAGTEFFSNFDIAYSLRVLANDFIAQTEYNVLQIFRKIIFYGLFFSSSLFLSIGSKVKFTRKFTFFYTLLVSTGVGFLGATICYLLKDIVVKLLNYNFVILSDFEVFLFLCFTAIMSAAYILSNWLLSLKKRIYTFIPLIASGFQAIIFIFSSHDIHSLLTSFAISSSIFYLLSVGAGIREVYFINHAKS